MVKSCCGLCRRKKHKEGILAGENLKLHMSMENLPIIKIFEDRLKDKIINPKKTAVHFSERNVLTYSQLNTFASCLSKKIIERLESDLVKCENPDKDVVIAVCLGMSEKSIALILGIMKTGLTYLPLDSKYPEAFLLQIISLVKPIMLITDDNGNIFNKYDSGKFGEACQLVSIEELWIDVDFRPDYKKRPSMDIAWDIEFLDTQQKQKIPDDLRTVAIFHSHGFRDNPVAVRVTNKSVLNLVLFHWNKTGVKRKDVCCMTTSLASPVSLPQMFIPLLLGCTLHVFRRSDVQDKDNFLKTISWRGVTRLSIATQTLGNFLDAIEFMGTDTMLKSLKHLKTIICRGSFIDLELANWFFSVFKSGVKLYNCVGIVQTTDEIAFAKYDCLADYKGKLVDGVPSFGTIVDNSKVYIVDKDLKLVPDGTQGEICVTGVCLAMGYVGANDGKAGQKGGKDDKKGGKDDKKGGKADKKSGKAGKKGGDKTNEAGQYVMNPFGQTPDEDRLYRTGEFGRIVKCDYLKQRRLITEGRHDSLITVCGNVCSSDDIKQFLLELDKVQDAKVVVQHACSPNQNVIAFIKLKGKKGKGDELQGEFDYQLRNSMPEWMIPTQLEFVDKIEEDK